MKDRDSREIFQTFRTLRGKEKVQYFMDYMLAWTAVIVVAILAVIWIVMRIVTWKGSVVDVLFVNTDIEAESEIPATLFDRFVEKQGLSPDKYEVDCSITNDIVQTKESMNNQSNQAMQAIEMQLYGNLIDVVFADQLICETIAQEGFLQDVRTFLPDDLIKQYEDAFVWIDFHEDGQKHAIGVRLDQNNKFMKQSGIYDGDTIMGVVVGCPQDANAKAFMISVLRGEDY